MYGKALFVDVLRTYFLVVAMINVVMLVLGTQIAPDERFGYDAFASPLIYGAAGTLPEVVMYSRRELKVKELMIRKMVQLLLVEGLVLFVAFYTRDPFWQQPGIILAVAICIFIIYIIGCLIDWIQNSVSARKMTVELMKFQHGIGE